MAYVNARRTLVSTLSRALSSSSSSSSAPSRCRCIFALAAKQTLPVPDTVKFSVRTKSSGSGYSPLNDPSPNWSNRPPKETILLDGCDYEHWLIVMEFPENPKPTEQEMVNAYVKTLAQIVGSDEEAMKKIYSVSTHTYTGFGALISEELSYKVKELPGVLWVLPDSYLDVPNKDYGGDLFVDGKVIPRPQYRYAERQPTKTRPRPRHDRRRETMQVERRDPNQRQNWNQGQGGPMDQSAPMNSQRQNWNQGQGGPMDQSGPMNNQRQNWNQGQGGPMDQSGPMDNQRQNWNQGQGGPMDQSAPMNSQRQNWNQGQGGPMDQSGPMNNQRQNWNQGQGGPMDQSAPMNSQNSASDGEN